MSIGTKLRAGVIAALAFGAAASVAATSVEARTMRHHMRKHYSRQMVYRPLTVAGAPVQPIQQNPYGPLPIVTGPTAFAGNVVGLPFRALGTIFPTTGTLDSNPLIIVGVPLRYAGQLAQLPFYLVGRTFGANPTFPN